MIARLIRTVSLLALGVVVACVGTFFYILTFYVQNDVAVHDCAVVFGAAVWPGGVASHALSDRVHAGIDVYEQGKVSCLVFSGAPSVYGKHEVDVMLDVAYERGVALEDIELDYGGLNTRQTIENLDPSRSYLLVSNDFHLARIHLLARKSALKEAQVYRSPYRFGRYTKEPQFVFREIVAFWYYFFQ